MVGGVCRSSFNMYSNNIGDVSKMDNYDMPEDLQDIEGTYCTCQISHYDEHTCPYDEELFGDEEDIGTCTCCPYCTEQCCMDI